MLLLVDSCRIGLYVTAGRLMQDRAISVTAARLMQDRAICYCC